MTYTATDGTRTTVGTITINTLVGAPGVTVPGSSSDETIYGTPSADTLNGSGGSDIVIAGAGNDVSNGGDGADRLEWRRWQRHDGWRQLAMTASPAATATMCSILSTGTDVIDGGANTERLDFSAATTAPSPTPWSRARRIPP